MRGPAAMDVGMNTLTKMLKNGEEMSEDFIEGFFLGFASGVFVLSLFLLLAFSQ